jgi:hypothetical protein
MFPQSALNSASVLEALKASNYKIKKPSELYQRENVVFNLLPTMEVL